MRYLCAFALQHLAFGLLVDYAAMDHPGIDNFLDGAGERRVQRSAPNLHEHAGDELLHRCEFQARIALMGKASVTCDTCVNLLTPTADFIGCEPSVKRLVDNFANEFVDAGSAPFDDRFIRPDTCVSGD